MSHYQIVCVERSLFVSKEYYSLQLTYLQRGLRRVFETSPNAAPPVFVCVSAKLECINFVVVF